MKTLAATESRTFRLIGAAMVLFCLFVAFASIASVPLCETTAGAAWWTVVGILNLTVGTWTLFELALSRLTRA